jgi:uncharacterized protein YqhQ
LPGGLRVVEDGCVQEGVLGRADAARALPRLGGMARPDGVIVVSERFWALARVDGSLREGAMPPATTAFRRVPLVRGLARLAASLSPLFRRTGVARRPERLLLAAAVLAPLGFAFLPERAGLVAGVAVTAGLLAWLLRGRTLFLHGAEHRAIRAAEERRLVDTWAGQARPSRFSLRCGTNFAVLVLPVAVAAERFWPLHTTLLTPLLVAVLSLALTMELWLLVQASPRRLARAFLVPGLGLQRLTTREPTLPETRVALTAVAAVLRRELDDPPA